MISPGKTKCARYWPEVGGKEEYGAVEVTNVSELDNKDYILRQFSVKSG